jgi:two-component system, NarL family, response regulator DesR
MNRARLGRIVITLMLVQHCQMLRRALAELLNLEPDIEVVAEVASGDEILPSARRCRADVAVVDIDMPDGDALIFVREITRNVPDMKTIILTAPRPGTMRRVLSANVGGFLHKDAAPQELVAAIRSVARGRRVVDNQLALAALYSNQCPLTEREIEVPSLAANGAEVNEIARMLFLSGGTIRNYLASITNKLKARNRIDAIRIATEAGWL